MKILNKNFPNREFEVMKLENFKFGVPIAYYTYKGFAIYDHKRKGFITFPVSGNPGKRPFRTPLKRNAVDVAKDFLNRPGIGIVKPLTEKCL